MMDYREARARLKVLEEKRGMVPGLDNMKRLAERLSNPQDSLRVIHAAGTNGKGSVMAYIESVLMEAGRTVVRYSSPAVFSYRERITCNRAPISEDDFASLTKRVLEAAEDMDVTVFEAETAMAYLYGVMKQCDICLVETGMGGAEDATNIERSVLASVITSISLDHCRFLGDTEEKIARVKAGIMKTGCPVVVYPQKPSVTQALMEEAERLHCPVIVPEAYVRGERKDCMQQFFYGGHEFYTPLLGEHQILNCITAIETLGLLPEQGIPLSYEVVFEGLKKTVWPGRMELCGRNRDVLLDGAHNPDAAERLAQGLKNYFPGKDMIYIIGIFRDKDYGAVLDKTIALCSEAVAVTAPGTRGLNGERLAECIRERGKPAVYKENYRDAYRYARNHMRDNGLIVVFGTLSILKIMKAFAEEMEDSYELGRKILG